MTRKKVTADPVVYEKFVPKAAEEPVVEPTVVDEGQARADRATRVMLLEALWPEKYAWGLSGLVKGDRY